MKKFFVDTFGCRTNFYDTDYLVSALQRYGYKRVNSLQEADVVIVNSCSVTHKAERESRRAVRKAKRFNKTVVYTGCAAKLRPYELADYSGSIEQVLEDFFGIKDAGFLTTITRARGILKVQEGCDFACTYCSIRFSRGPSRSLPLERILTEAENLSRLTREIVITGTQVGDWGREWGMTFSQLIDILTSSFKDVRFRLSSIEPTHVDDYLIELVASRDNLCPHFHISAQSGSDKVLKDMNRPYDRKTYEGVLKRILSRIPDVAIGTDIIVAFPTETEEDFEQTLDLIESYPFAYVHAFEYSPRLGTPAYELGELPSQVRKERVRRMQELISKKKKEYRAKFLGKILQVHVETVRDSLAQGVSENYLKVMFPAEGARVGDLVPVLVVEDRGVGALSGVKTGTPR